MNDVQDWHPADIIAVLRKRGTTLSAVSREAGLASNTLTNALARRWPKGEQIIAEALDCSPAEIWSSRYLIKENIISKACDTKLLV
ncbi:helix-turn-helix domain-containing protein [Photorhabdus luminescens]|uniref:DNA-binding protein n=1 Tax=Photorhabdus luminescens subsp. mexicana TaxID=2100167 RepID=A0A4R4J335_PHOLU|nr:helix-turn-helix transcriptional regulator [Photorhabdus luminescens]TDB47894.1 DNA-binding protein [Photorhabdus luminescens subsp. mexicana]